ncbi:MAG TPA: hypothetical protein VFR31_22490 [Thermoanaerobaculia bacterium]|nr:hypothetical protein [Thermoanaerobaculia bacterium]
MMRSPSVKLVLVAILLAVPVAAQNIPAGDDIWDTVGGGATNTMLLSADWFALCGVTVPDTTVQFKGYNINGYGTGDTVITRTAVADFSSSSTVTVPIQLKELSFVSVGTHPCSPATLWVHEEGTQQPGSMTITRTGPAGGTYSATVEVSGEIEAKNGSTVIGSVPFDGTFNDPSSSPWSYTPPTGGTSGKPWYPSVDPATGQPAGTCRFGTETAPSSHCYQYPPKCKSRIAAGSTSIGVGGDDSAEPAPAPAPLPAEPCAIAVDTTDTAD